MHPTTTKTDFISTSEHIDLFASPQNIWKPLFMRLIQHYFHKFSFVAERSKHYDLFSGIYLSSCTSLLFYIKCVRG